MKIGFVGIGKMGKNMVLNLLEHKHQVVAYDRTPKAVKTVVRKGATGAYTLKELVAKLPKQKIIWVMITAGKPVDQVLNKLLPYLKRGDIIIDGGNSFYKDSLRRYMKLKKKGISFVDCGTSGGVQGARYGACMMVGGDKKVFKKVEVLFRDMCVKNGYGYIGKAGAGHFVKMVHNGIEYGMMAATAEGIQAIDKYKKKFGINMNEVVKVYAHGSIIESRLMSWLYESYQQKGYLASIAGKVPKGATEDEMKHLETIAAMPVLHQARLLRVKSRKKPSLAGKIMAALRNKFGGHAVEKK